MVNMAVVAPMPRARVSTAMMLKAGLLRSCRRVYFRSWLEIVMGVLGSVFCVQRAIGGPTEVGRKVIDLREFSGGMRREIRGMGVRFREWMTGIGHASGAFPGECGGISGREMRIF